MDEARVLINLKESIIELQGPVDFVRQYLDMYQPAIKGLQSLSKEVAVSPEKTEALPRKRKTVPVARAKRAGRISCMVAIRSDLEAGFFNEPRSIGDIKQRLNEAGFSFSDSNIRNSLKKLATSGQMETTGTGRALRYQVAEQPVQPT